MTEFSKYVYAMGRGPSKGRNLTLSESQDAMAQILDGTVDAHAIGALLMLMRYRGETPEEIAGFVKALRNRVTGWGDLNTAIDWPSYAAGRTRGLPWFLLAAKLVARAGHRVFLHGWNSNQASNASVLAGVQEMGITIAADPLSAKSALKTDNLVYAPLETLDEAALKVLQLRGVLGLRSAINTALRGYNPTNAPVSVQGVFHPSYRELQAKAAAILGQDTFAVIKGGGGEFEVNPSKDIEIYFQINGKLSQSIAPARFEKGQRLAQKDMDKSALMAVWTGDLVDPFAQSIVTSTAAIALQSIDQTLSHRECISAANVLWETRFEGEGASK